MVSEPISRRYGTLGRPSATRKPTPEGSFFGFDFEIHRVLHGFHLRHGSFPEKRKKMNFVVAIELELQRS